MEELVRGWWRPHRKRIREPWRGDGALGEQRLARRSNFISEERVRCPRLGRLINNRCIVIAEARSERCMRELQGLYLAIAPEDGPNLFEKHGAVLSHCLDAVTDHCISRQDG